MSKRTECGWSGPLPEVGQPGFCQACQRTRTFGDVKHKRCLQQPAAEPPRYDWFAEHPCPHRGAVTQTLKCGCPSKGSVVLRRCHDSGGECTANDDHRSRLQALHLEVYNACRSCESCPARTGDSA